MLSQKNNTQQISSRCFERIKRGKMKSSSSKSFENTRVITDFRNGTHSPCGCRGQFVYSYSRVLIRCPLENFACTTDSGQFYYLTRKYFMLSQQRGRL